MRRETNEEKFIRLLDSIIPQEQEKEKQFDIRKLNSYIFLKNILFFLTILFYNRYKRLLFPKSSFKISYFGFEIIYDKDKFIVDCNTNEEWKYLENVLLLLWKDNSNWREIATQTKIWKNKNKSNNKIIKPEEMVKLLSKHDV